MYTNFPGRKEMHKCGCMLSGGRPRCGMNYMMSEFWAMVPVKNLLLYSRTFLEKGRDGAGFNYRNLCQCRS